jgi:hydrogenase expression/formation protein HypC
VCLAIPGKVLLLDEQTQMGTVDFGGIRKSASFACLPEAKIGDFVLVHVGLAISVVDPHEAKRVFEFLEHMDELGELRNDANASPAKKP